MTISSGRGRRWLGGLLALLMLQSPAWPAATQDKSQIPSSGLTETSSVSLTLLDVVVADKKGRPIRGLKKKDFLLFLNSIVWDIYSVDDLCTCTDTRPPSSKGGAVATQTGETPPHSTAEIVSATPAGTAPAPREEVGEAVQGTPPGGAGAARRTETGSTTGQAQASAAPKSGGSESQAREGNEAGTGSDADRAQGSAEAGADANAGASPTEPIRFVLYLDFSELQVTSRGRALAAARKWIKETKRPDDETMVAAYAPVAGLTELTHFTKSANVLLGALDRVAKDPKFQTTFPDYVRFRHDECEAALKDPWQCQGQDECQVCDEYARQEYQQGLYSMRALKSFLSDLQTMSGRKALLYFHENGVVYPHRLYTGTEDLKIGNHEKLLDQVGAEASLSRTVIYSAYAGDRLAAQHGSVEETLSDGALDLGSNLADLTGGKYNRDLSDLSGLLANAGERCPCIYRIAIVPPDHPTSTVYEVRVQVGDLVMPYNQRVQFLDEQSRWLKKAVAALKHPEQAGDLGVGAAIVPRGATGGLWTVDVEVGLNLGSLEMIPASGGWQGSWEAGALFASEDGAPSWEMLGISSLRKERDRKSQSAVLHEHTFKGLAPGRYKLAAFARDKTAGVFGGAEASIELPAPGKDAAIGPVIQQGRRPRMVVALPIYQKKAAEDSRANRLETGPVPLVQGRAVVGEDLEATTWICSQGAPPQSSALQRFISRSGKPLYRLEPAVLVPSGACYQLTDRVPTKELVPGSYTYTLRWRRPGGSDPVSVSADFTLLAPPPSPAAAPPATAPVDGPSAESPAAPPAAPPATAPVDGPAAGSPAVPPDPPAPALR